MRARLPRVRRPRSGRWGGGELHPSPLKPVRLGLRLVAGLAEEEAKKLIAARTAGARSLEALARRAGLARGVLERIARADAFRSTDLDRRAALWRASGMRGERKLEAEAPLLAAIPASGEGRDDLLPVMPTSEHVAEDYRTIGLSLKAHPCAFFRDALGRRGVIGAADLERLPAGRKVRVAGLVLNRQRPGAAKNVMFATLEDETGIANLVIWDRIFQNNRRVLMTAGFLAVEGEIQTASGVIHVIVERAFDLTSSLSRLSDSEAQQQTALQRSRDFH
jgi:error-prone DNA polymerase